MTNSLTKAFADSQRSYFAAKASVSELTSQMMATGPHGVPGMGHHDLGKAQEQLRHFRGWVYTSVRPIAQRIAGQPIHVGKLKSKLKNGTKRFQPANINQFDDHPILDLLNDPNDLMVAWSLIFSTVSSLELTGRQLWYMPKKKKIFPIPTSWIRDIEGSTSIDTFKIQTPYSVEEFPIPAKECVYFSYPHPGDPHGAIAPLQAVAYAVDADESMQISQTAMFRKGIHPSHVVVVGKNPNDQAGGGIRPRLTSAQRRQIISAIQKQYAGYENHNEPMIIDGLIEDVKKLSNTPAEMDWLNSGKITKARIMQGFGVNPIIAGEIEGSNRASATAADKHFCDFTINPKIELMSQVLTGWLRPMFGNDIVVWIEPCVASDAEMALKWINALASYSAITGDEMRELSPFDLKIGGYKQPVSRSARRDPQTDDVITALNRSTDILGQPIEDTSERMWRESSFDLDGNVEVRSVNGRSH